MGGFFGGGGTSKSTTDSTVAPWGPVQPYLMGAMQSAQNLYNQGTPQLWSGPYMAPQSAQTQGAIQGITNLTNSGVPQQQIGNAQNIAGNIAAGQGLYQGSPFLTNLLYGGGGAGNQYGNSLMGQFGGVGPQNLAQAQAQGTLAGLASGQNVNTNPYLNSMYQSAATPMIQQWQNQIQPGIEAAFSAAGRYGNPNQNPSGALGSTMNQAQTGLGQGLASLASNLYGNAYNTNVAQQTNALNTLANLGTTQTGQQINLGSLLGNLQNSNVNAALGLNQTGTQGGALQLAGAQAMPSLAMAGYQPYQALGTAGATMDQYNNANQQYQEQLYNYNNGQGAWQTLQNYTNLLAANPASRATQTNSTVTSQAPTQSGFSQLLGGLGAIGGLASGFGAPLLGGIGALASGGGLSDALMAATSGQSFGGALNNFMNNSYGFYGAPGSTTAGGWTIS